MKLSKKRLFISGLIGTISVPLVLTAASCSSVAKVRVKVTKGVTLSTKSVVKNEKCEIFLKATSNDQRINSIDEIKIGDATLSRGYDYDIFDVKEDNWTHKISITNADKVVDTININCNLINIVHVSTDTEGVELNTTYAEKNKLLQLEMRATSGGGVAIKSLTQVAINGKPTDKYVFEPVLDGHYTHKLVVTDPLLIDGDVVVSLEVEDTKCSVQTNVENVGLSKFEALKNNSLSVYLTATEEQKDLDDNLISLTIGGNPVTSEKYTFERLPYNTNGWTHELQINQPEIVTGDIVITPKVIEKPYQISINDPNILLSKNMVMPGEDLELYFIPKEDYIIDSMEEVKVGGTSISEYSFGKVGVAPIEGATHVLTIDKSKINGDIKLTIKSHCTTVNFILEGEKEGAHFTASKTKIQKHDDGRLKDEIYVNVEHPDDNKLKLGPRGISIGRYHHVSAAIDVKESADPNWDYVLDFCGVPVDVDDDVFLGLEVITNKVQFDLHVVDEQDVDAPAHVTSELFDSGVWHNDKATGKIILESDAGFDYKITNLSMFLIYGGEGSVQLLKGKDYIFNINVKNPRIADLIINEGVITNHPYFGELTGIKLTCTVRDSSQHHMIYVTDHISSFSLEYSDSGNIIYNFDNDPSDFITDKTKTIDAIDIYRRSPDDEWLHLTPEKDYVFDVDKQILSINRLSFTNDLRVELHMVCKPTLTFENDNWRSIGYWSSTEDMPLFKSVYNIFGNDGFIGREKTVEYDGIAHKVRVIGEQTDLLHYSVGPDGELDQPGGPTLLTFEFEELLRDKNGHVTLDIGEEETSNQLTWQWRDKKSKKWGHQSNIRTYLKETFPQKVDKYLLTAAKEIGKEHCSYIDFEPGEGKFILNSSKFNDTFFILTATEMNGHHGGGKQDEYFKEGVVYPFYDDQSDGHDDIWEPRAKKWSDSEFEEYWTASISGKYRSIGFGHCFDCAIRVRAGSSPGDVSYTCIDAKKGIAPCFCI